MAYSFRSVSRALRDGDPVDTPDLNKWVGEANGIIFTLSGIPEYHLVVADLIHETSKAQHYLDYRKYMSGPALTPGR